jgi:hypothetical protein
MMPADRSSLVADARDGSLDRSADRAGDRHWCLARFFEAQPAVIRSSSQVGTPA